MKSIQMSDALGKYLLSVSPSDDDVMQELRAVTSEMPAGGMQIPPYQGRFMQFLASLLGVTRYVEVGCFTGYSALAVAQALPPDGKVITCDISAEWTATAREYWRKAGVADRIELRLGPAVDTLQRLLDAGAAESFDMAFIDADKGNYVKYYELCLQLVRTGGVILIDNALWGGSVADRAVQDEDTAGIRAVNQRALEDPRVDTCLLPMSDGVHLCHKL